MGVHGLWELLSPVGRRVSVETLAGKRLAIDASIWMVQFMKAMRDERGEMVRNAHLLGFFRRICKLLYLRTKPVFVFDGGTPALKRRTLIARRRQRDNAQAKVRKTAEKLLLNHLRAMKLREIAKDIESQKQKQKQKLDAKKRRILPEQPEIIACSSQTKEAMEQSLSQNKLDEMMGIFTEVNKQKILRDDALASAVSSPCEADSDEDEDAKIILVQRGLNATSLTHELIIMKQSIDGEVDPDVLAALPLSVQHKLVQKDKRDAKGKKVFSDPISFGNDSERITENSKNTCQENLDEILAASLMEEEEENHTANVLGTADINLDAEDSDDEDEEMIISELHGEVDPSILASLPPSMQLDLLVQMREKLMAENRQKYKKVKKDPAKFSELQIQAYLKTVAFRREINEVQKAASGSGVAGVQTSRIASEANREFIFSSSFTGDKKELAHDRAQRNGKDLQQEPRQVSKSLNKDKSSQSNTKNGSTSDEPTSSFYDTETYVDEMGRVRVSRVRGMGMRLTRDLQRNLDLMKEIENEKNNGKTIANSESMKNPKIGGPESFASENQSTEISFEGNSKLVTLNDGTEKGVNCSLPTKENEVESFPSEKQFAVVHEGTEHLNDKVRQTTVKHDTLIEIAFEDNGKKSFDEDDDLFARLVSENPVQNHTLLHNLSRTKSSDFFLDFKREDGMVGPGNDDSGSDPKFEIRSNSREGNISDDSEIDWEEGEINTISFQNESVKAFSKGSLEEEADLQEAVRRSLEDFNAVSENDNRKGLIGNGSKDIGALELNVNIERLEQPFAVNETDHAQTIVGFPWGSGNSESEKRHRNEESRRQESISTLATNKIHWVAEQPLDNFDKDCELSRLPNKGLEEFFFTSDSNRQEDAKTHFEVEFDNSLARTKAVILQVESSPQKFTDDNCVEENLPAENIQYDIFNKENDCDKSIREDIDEAKLEEEIVFLDQERLNLGNEQRKFERDAESVSSEMFVECQELLQMFGLPYIIAPMEAEAQCAYMELENLVDGVVTDDSDVFLFGACNVYKNIFDDRKYVETYFMKDIENELGLAREKLIRMALLLGSDYTEGVSGIGIVNAIEVVNAFPEEDGLHKFREWIESPDPTILGKLGAPKESSQRKRGPKAGELGILDSNSDGAEDSAAEQNHDQSADLSKDKQIFMDKHRNVSKNWHIPLSFPSNEVFSAYLNPQVDKSTESFSWGKPDHLFLRKLCWEKFGWDNKKADELVLPVLKEYSKHETQLRMEAFYTFNERFAKIRSKRIKKAVKGITGNSSALLMNDVLQDGSRSRKKKTANSIETDGGGLKESDSVENATPKARRSRPGKAVKVSVKDTKLPMQEDHNRCMIEKRAQGNKRSTGKRGRKVGAGRREREVGGFSTDSAGASSSNGEDEPQDIRRSSRQKKPVNYSEADNAMGQPVNQKDERLSNKEAEKVEVSNDQLEREEKHKEHNLDGPSLEQTSGRESVFCPIEDENRQQQASFQEDCLKMGGGFCVDEDENAHMNEESRDQERVLMADEGIFRESVDGSGKADESVRGNVELDFDSGRRLRAMPNLRRKRRKC